MLVGVLVHDPTERRAVGVSLRSAGHETVTTAAEPAARREFGTDSCIEVLVLDVDPLHCDGLDVCVALRASGQHAPVLFLTTPGSPEARLACFRVGGESYLDKPVDHAELLARVEALGRRGRQSLSRTPGLELDPVRHAVRSDTGEAPLTPTEFRMLAAITTRPSEVVPRHVVMSAAWPDKSEVTGKTVDSFMRQIRVKLDAVGSAVEIETVRGVGYRLR